VLSSAVRLVWGPRNVNATTHPLHEWARSLLVALLVVAPVPAAAEVHVAGPDDYLEKLHALKPGDTLALMVGTYDQGLPVHGLEGTAEQPIHIAGPAGAGRAIIQGRRRSNIVSIVDSAHVTIRDLYIDGTGTKRSDGVKAEGHAQFAHHITLRNLVIENVDHNQQIVGISTKCPAWGWVISDNVIRGAGTGMYLGDSDGSAPFIDGVIEHNLVTDTIGYGLQIKHQNERPFLEGLPDEPSRTVIRHNVFAKGESSSEKSARPNVLLGHFPETGPGTSDRYAVYGNLFYNNPTERLFQGEGNIALYNNLFVNPAGGAIAIMPHKGDPRRIDIFQNTIVARDTGIWFQRSERTERALVRGNAVFAGKPFSGDGAGADGNVHDDFGQAEAYLRAPHADPGKLDLVPRGDRLAGSIALPPEVLWDLPDAGRDFDGVERSGERLGAYEGVEGQPRWMPELAIKPVPQGDRSATE